MVNGEKAINVARAAFAATIGNLLEFYDLITYSFFAIQIGHTFFPAQGEYGSLMRSLATFGAGFLTVRSAASCSASTPIASVGAPRCS
jgi:hypothetical protein